MSLRQGGKIIAGNVSHYNIGDTFMTKRTDNTLNGAVECDGATYNTTDFTGSGSIGELLEAGKLDYVSLSAYSDAIAQTGWCDKIGWDGAGNTVFRVPTINPRHYIIKSQEPTAENNYTWYNLYANGWVEQGGRTSNFTNTAQSTGESKTVVLPIVMSDTNYTVNASMCSDLSLGNGSVSGYANRVIKPGTMTTTGFTIEQWALGAATGTSIIACWQVSGVSSITPQTNARVMIQLFNSTTDEAVATVGGVLADVADLKDLSNITAGGKEVCANMAMPSDRYIDLTMGATLSTYVAPADGWYYIEITLPSGAYFNANVLDTNERLIYRITLHSTQAGYNQGDIFPVKKGDIIYVEYNNISTTNRFRFIYAQGAQ